VAATGEGGRLEHGKVKEAGQIWALRATWVMFIALPMVALAAELALSLEWLRTKKTSEAFGASNPFLTTNLQEATAKTLWKKPWHAYQPGAHLETRIGDELYAVTINSLGFRTHEFTEQKPPGTLRIVCIGGSTTVQGRTNDETYPAILERRLRAEAPSRPLEVLNLGVSGSYSDRWVSSPDALFRFSPDIVLEYDAINDIMWRALPRYGASHPLRRLSYRSLLAERLFPIDPTDLDQDFRGIIANQARLAELCRARGVLHVAGSFAFPDLETAPPAEKAFLARNLSEWTADSGGPMLRRYQDFARLMSRYDELFEASSHKGAFVGLPIHRGLGDASLYIDICHMNPRGIERLALAFERPVLDALNALDTHPLPVR
jgi:hypothetical protein